jgi:hypothetical protein
MSTTTINIHELADELHVSLSTILKGRRKGHPLYTKGFKVGDALNSPLRWYVDDVNAFMQSKRQQAS